MAHLRIVIDVNTSKAIADQMSRTGFELVREGDSLVVRVPNRVVRSKDCKIECQRDLPPDPQPAVVPA